MKAKIFSDGSVVSTVTWPYQFSWMNTADKQRTRVLSATWAECIDQIRAWRESGERDITEGATHYHATYVKPDWAAEMKFIKRIGRHLFYRRES